MGEYIDFKHNKISNFEYLEPRNMMMCTYLNLRESSIKYLTPGILLSLVYIDIAYSNI